VGLAASGAVLGLGLVERACLNRARQLGTRLSLWPPKMKRPGGGGGGRRERPATLARLLACGLPRPRLPKASTESVPCACESAFSSQQDRHGHHTATCACAAPAFPFVRAGRLDAAIGVERGRIGRRARRARMNHRRGRRWWGRSAELRSVSSQHAALRNETERGRGLCWWWRAH